MVAGEPGMRGGVVLSSSSGSRNARVILGVAGFSGKRSSNSDGDLVGVGWHKDGLVGAAGFEPATPRL